VIFVLQLLVVAVEILLAVVVLLLGVMATIVFRRPWAIDAFARDGTHLRWKEVEWRKTTARMEEITAALSHGVIPPGVELLHAEAAPPAPPPPPSPAGWDGTQGPFGSGT